MSIKSIVEEMIREKCKLYQEHPDTVAGHIAHERAVTNDYRGRVLYELLQNAVDRAETTIWIVVDPDSRSLTVANDGQPFEAHPRRGEPRSDLAALCSIDTSNKKPGESIGNKGVGFKSVWEFCSAVSIRTRGETDIGSWGIRLRRPFTPGHLDRWEDSHSADLILDALETPGIEKQFRRLAPSFYFPEFTSNPLWKEEGAVTAIELEDIEHKDFERLVSGPLKELKAASLEFVCDVRADKTPLNLIIKSGSGNVSKPLFTASDAWIRVEVDTSNLADELTNARDSLGFELKRLSKLVLGFQLPKEGEEFAAGKFHGYLPTEVDTGSPLHIQGDFYLSESRKHIDFQNNRYNELLLELAVDALFSSIIENSNVARLPYVFQLLRGSGPLAKAISKRLIGNGQLLSQLIGAAVSSAGERRKSYFDELYQLIAAYIPPKADYSHSKTYYRDSLDPYLVSFAKDDLKIVPTSLNDEGTEEDPLVTSACSLPRPKRDGSIAGLFCRGRASTGLKGDPIDLPGIAVTEWRFPGDAKLAETLREGGVWSEYEAISVLRAIVRGLRYETCEDLKLRFLRAARDIYSPRKEEGSSGHTNWRFLARDDAFPSQRLLIPVLPSGSWAQVRESFLAPDLSAYLDLQRVSQIDDAVCEQILGSDYLRILRHWGVWDVVPLVSSKDTGGKWQVPIKDGTLLSGNSALKLLSISYSVWMSSDLQRDEVKKALKDLADLPWLKVASGSRGLVSPSMAYFGLVQGDVLGFPVLESDALGVSEKHFLENLGVRSVEQTVDLKKLVRTLEDIAVNCSHAQNISGSIRSVYRQIIKQVNKLLINSEQPPAPSMLNRIPLLYEENISRKRGMAGPADAVWYVSEALRNTRGKISSAAHYWWLANGDLGTLASRLDRVHSLSLRSPISTASEFLESEDMRHLLETEYLPYFLALACYGDLPGLVEVQESTIQKRWQTLVVLRGEHAQQDERIGTNQVEVQSTSTMLSKKRVLWEPLRADSSRNLALYIWSRADQSAPEFKYQLCDWFSEEVFRRPQLALHFKKLVESSMSTETVDLSRNAVADASALIRDWLPDLKLDALVSELSAITGIEFSKTNWRDQNLLKGLQVSFDQITHQLPDELKGYLGPLDPKFTNQSRLLEFVEQHKSQLAATEKFGDYDDDDWITLLQEDSVRLSYNFEPFQWVLDALSLTEEQFNSLKGRLNGELRKAEREAERMGLHIPRGAVSDLKAPLIKWSPQIPRSPGRIFEAMSEEDRIKDQVNRSKSGRLAEKLTVFPAARRAAALEVEEQQELLGLVRGEYARITQEYPRAIGELLKLPEAPCTEATWYEALHLASRWDGLGYDYLDFEHNDDGFRLLLVEVKSSRRNDPSIYLSENERLCVLKYTGSQFKAAYPNATWTMILLTAEKMIDVTQSVVQVIGEHAGAYEEVPSVMAADGWIIRTSNLY
ncbi:hypothetical protein SAMN04488490_0286 [Marinobacter sp. LV10R510-11A]|uniref:sacsin N-terminal ATP-binding-like domain-containing protein n=1 Tax=Marinobacter sp. LV10R510-11A TaxID=1415568 RepID=UPI000BB805B0|nr:hypothetical protein [Marinobacter sp. LV10R510-11A]SOB74757.1 hypothetical protein SAMN04488490_0286 [Marinobacter sp. LV10R510-11A]